MVFLAGGVILLWNAWLNVWEFHALNEVGGSQKKADNSVGREGTYTYISDQQRNRHVRFVIRMHWQSTVEKIKHAGGRLHNKLVWHKHQGLFLLQAPLLGSEESPSNLFPKSCDMLLWTLPKQATLITICEDFMESKFPSRASPTPMCPAGPQKYYKDRA